MNEAFLQRMARSVRQLLPVVVTCLLIFVTAMPLRIPDWTPVAPLFPLIAIYYWSIYRPELMTSLIAFSLGLLNDVVSNLPLGISALIYLLVRGLTTSQRRFFLGKSFLVGWFGFTLVGAGAFLGQWLLVAIMNGHIPAGHAVLVELLMTVMSYPLLSWVLTRAQILVLRDL